MQVSSQNNLINRALGSIGVTVYRVNVIVIRLVKPNGLMHTGLATPSESQVTVDSGADGALVAIKIGTILQ